MLPLACRWPGNRSAAFTCYGVVHMLGLSSDVGWSFGGSTLASGFLASEVFPPLDRHVDVGGVDLDGVDPAPLPLAGNDCSSRADERIVDVTHVVTG